MTDTTHGRSWWKPGRSDFLIARLLTLVVALIGSIGVLQGRITDWITGQPLRWTSYSDEATGPGYPGADPVAGVAVHYDRRLVWEKADASAGAWLLSLVPDLITAAALVIGGLLVLRLIDRVEVGDPFGGPSVRQVRALAVVVLGYAVLTPFLRTAVDTLLTFTAQADPVYVGRIDASAFVLIAAGMVLLLLAEVWRRGAELRDDVAGLV